MRKTTKSALTAVLCAATALSALPPKVAAGPVGAANPADARQLIAPVQNAHYWRRHRHYGYYGYDPSGAIFAGAMLGLMGAGIAAAASRPYYYYGYPYGYGYYGWGYPAYYYGPGYWGW